MGFRFHFLAFFICSIQLKMVNYLSVQSTVALVMAVASLSANAQNTTASSTSTSSGVPAQVSPAWLSDITPIAGNVKAYPSGTNASIPTGPLPTVNFSTTAYPEGWKSPSTTSAEVQAVIKALDWTKVKHQSFGVQGACI